MPFAYNEQDHASVYDIATSLMLAKKLANGTKQAIAPPPPPPLPPRPSKVILPKGLIDRINASVKATSAKYGPSSVKILKNKDASYTLSTDIALPTQTTGRVLTEHEIREEETEHFLQNMRRMAIENDDWLSKYMGYPVPVSQAKDGDGNEMGGETDGADSTLQDPLFQDEKDHQETASPEKSAKSVLITDEMVDSMGLGGE